MTRLVLLCLGLTGLLAQAQQVPKRLVADYGFWSASQTPPYGPAQIPYHKLTHINFDDGTTFDANGNLSGSNPQPELVSRAHAAGVKVGLLFGGNFPALEGTGSLPNLLANLRTYINANGYDGLDIDWEYPSSTADTQLFTGLMNGLRNTFPSPAYYLSADIPPWGGAYNIPGILDSIDWINIMMYDCAGPWTDDGQLNSPIFPNGHNPQPWECEPGGSVEQTATIFMNHYHVPASMLNMGTPFYGYFYRNVTEVYGPCRPCNNATVPSENYGTFIKQRINNLGFTAYFDEKSMVPYLLRSDGSPGFITYDDPLSTYTRIWYSEWQRGLGGGFMWSLDADYDGHSQDLLDAMYKATKNMPFK